MQGTGHYDDWSAEINDEGHKIQGKEVLIPEV
jgi:hypothetical protein